MEQKSVVSNQQHLEEAMRIGGRVKTIRNPAELRSLLAQSIVALLEGRIDIGRANAIVGLSSEMHKSMKQEWDMRCYVAESLHLEGANIKRIASSVDEDDEEEEPDFSALGPGESGDDDNS